MWNRYMVVYIWDTGGEGCGVGQELVRLGEGLGGAQLGRWACHPIW